MKKLLSIIALGSMSLLYACKDAPPEPTSPYYFRFEADGEAFDYKYECSGPFFGGGCTFGASFTGSATHHHFNIYGSSWVDKAATGEVLFYLNKDDVYEKDTIVLDGVENSVGIIDLNLNKYGISTYGHRASLYGLLIISERTDSSIKGTFEFDCYKFFINEGGTGELSDTVMQVRKGEFNVPAIFD